MSDAPDAPPVPPRSRTELFFGFMSIGGRAFGGVMPWAHRAMVMERRWLTAGEFAEVATLGQLLPGPNIVNVSLVLGQRWFGWSGAAVAFAGLMLLPFAVIIGLATVYADFVELPHVRGAVTGVGLAGAGLFVGTAFKLGKPLLRQPAALAIAAACFACVGILKLSILLVLPVATVLAYLAARLQRD